LTARSIGARRAPQIGADRGRGRSLDSEGSETYFALIPIHRSPGGALLRASVFSLDGLSSDEIGHFALWS